MQIRRDTIVWLAAMLAALIGVVAWRGVVRGQQQGPPEDQLPRFAQRDQLVKPVGWEAWVMVGASTGLSYAAAPPPAAGAAPGMFHNVYVQPWAYREFVRTGAFPQRTMFVLSFYEASRKSTPARAGFYEGDRVPAIEVHLKQAGIDKTGWGFFGFGDSAATAAMIPGAAPCYSCHATEAAHDQVFTQFYPPLRERLARAGGH
jgi:cytochrome P460